MDSPVMADFAAKLARINALAEQTPGFLWRLQTDAGDATALRPFLRSHGPTAQAFTFRQSYPAPDAVESRPLDLGDEFPA
jgi:hypothetical protein